jgi:hypothetical protein
MIPLLAVPTKLFARMRDLLNGIWRLRRYFAGVPRTNLRFQPPLEPNRLPTGIEYTPIPASALAIGCRGRDAAAWAKS